MHNVIDGTSSEYRVVPNIKDSNYESNAQLIRFVQNRAGRCSEYQR